MIADGKGQKMNIQQALKAIAQKRFSPVYILEGDEWYLQKLFKERLIANFLQQAPNNFNFCRYRLDESSLESAINEANTVSFFSEPKIIWLTELNCLTSGHKLSEHATKMLVHYLKGPAPDVIVVFVMGSVKADKRKKAVKELYGASSLIDINAPGEGLIRELLETELKKHGKHLEQKAFNVLLQRTGGHLSECMAAINKLMIFTDGDLITEEMVSILIEPSLDDNIFHLVDYLMSGQGEAAFRLFRQLLAQKVEPISILAMLESNFRLFVQCKRLSQEGYQQPTIAQAIKAHPYRVKMAMPKLRGVSLNRVSQQYRTLIDLDYAFKTGQKDAVLGIECFMLSCLDCQSKP